MSAVAVVRVLRVACALPYVLSFPSFPFSPSPRRLRVDIVLNAIAFCFVAFELIISIHLLFTLSLAASRF